MPPAPTTGLGPGPASAQGNREPAGRRPLGLLRGPGSGGWGLSPHFRAGGGDWCHLQCPNWRAFYVPSGCCRSCLSSPKSGPCPTLGLCLIPWARVGPGWVLASVCGSGRFVGGMAGRQVGCPGLPLLPALRFSSLHRVRPRRPRSHLDPCPAPGSLLAAHQTARQHPLREPALQLHGRALVKKKYIFIIKAQMVFWHTSASLDIYQVF